jgi:NADH-quinone oxidoreductase subunit B
MGLNETLERDGFVLSTVSELTKWAQRNSLFPMPMGISCCAIEMMAMAAPRTDVARFGSEAFRFSPRQADLMIVAGTVTYKMSWVVRKIYDQMPDPKWVIAMGVCTSTGGMFRSYPVVQGIDQFLPVDVYVGGCPPRPEALVKALMTIQDGIRNSKPVLIDGAPSKAGLVAA